MDINCFCLSFAHRHPGGVAARAPCKEGYRGHARGGGYVTMAGTHERQDRHQILVLGADPSGLG